MWEGGGGGGREARKEGPRLGGGKCDRAYRVAVWGSDPILHHVLQNWTSFIGNHLTEIPVVHQTENISS